MGSRIMHIIIAKKISEELAIQDKQGFLLGAIAPDATNEKEVSHFYEGVHSDFTRRISYDTFLRKYMMTKLAEYVLGYYTHLIADDLWLTGFYLPWLKNRMENDKQVFTRYHNDFRLLNGKLLRYYRMGLELTDGLEHVFIPDLDEVPAKSVKAFLSYLKQDMENSQIDTDEPLQVFTLEQIIGYIETSVEKGIFYVEKYAADLS